MKQKENKSFFIIYIVLLIMLTTFSWTINDIYKQLSDAPKKVCHTEESVRGVEISSITTYITEGEEWFCGKGEEWYKISKEMKGAKTAGNYTVSCLVITTKEICEIK